MKNENGKNSGTKRRGVGAVMIAAAAALITLACFVLMLKSYPGMNIAFFIALAFSTIVLAHLLLRSLRAREKYSRLAKALQRCFLACLVLGVAGFITLQVLILSSARTEDAAVDCVIVLGAGIFGETPSRILASRLDSALEFTKGRNDIPIIVAGGQGPGETITEAEAMYRYLKRRGAEESQIWKEEESTSTWENIAFSLSVMEENGMDTENATVAIVTNEFHLFRAKHVAGTMGLDAIGVAAETPYPSLRILYHFREAAALLNSFLFSAKP